MSQIKGAAARTLIANQIALHGDGIAKALANYDPSDTAEKWHATIRAIEEFINVPLFGIDDDRLVEALHALPLDGRLLAEPTAMGLVIQGIARKFGIDLARRYASTIIQATAINIAFRQHGWREFGRGITLERVGDAIAYFQSRRRQLVAMFYSIPGMCKGTEKIASHDTLNVFLPQIEMSGISLISLHRQAVLADIFPGFRFTTGWHDHPRLARFPASRYVLSRPRAGVDRDIGRAAARRGQG